MVSLCFSKISDETSLRRLLRAFCSVLNTPESAGTEFHVRHRKEVVVQRGEQPFQVERRSEGTPKKKLPAGYPAGSFVLGLTWQTLLCHAGQG